MNEEINEKISEEITSDGKEKGDWIYTLIAAIILIVLVVKIPACLDRKAEEREAAEKAYEAAEKAYEESLPKAPDFISQQEIGQRAQKLLIGQRIEQTVGQLTTTYMIHNVECLKAEQTGVRKDTVDVTLRAYSYYLDGQITFLKFDKYTYNFDTEEWEYHSGDWTTENVRINK